MKLAFVAGTSGELIKLYPLLVAAQQRGLDWKVYSTGQSGINFVKQWKHFQLFEENLRFVLPADHDLDNSRQALTWFFKALFVGSNILKKEIAEANWVLVHGDTLSTLIGALWAKRLRLPLAHVEAGLRSKALFHPFPEEINRRWVSKLAQLHFAPDAWSAGNLKAVRGRVISTNGNTMGEALSLILSQPPPQNLPSGEFVLANIHRFENLNSKEHWRVIENTLMEAARKRPVYLVLHPQTEHKIKSEGRQDFLSNQGIHLVPRMPFHVFAHWLKAADFLITDGGSNQEECSYLGKPCLILRQYTERQEGLDGSCVLTGLKPPVISKFLEKPEAYRRPAQPVELKPSQIILDSLA